jgi:ferric-dicitrate binding protein FerR (iron transport regulator)
LKKRDIHNEETRRQYLELLIESGSEEALKQLEQSPAFQKVLEEEWDRRPDAGKPGAPGKDSMLERIIERTGRSGSDRKVRTLGSRLLKVAAVIAPFLLVSAGLFYFTMIRPGASGNGRIVEVVSEGEQVEQILPDGSLVILNTPGKLTFPEEFSRRDREVSLAGEAYFEVTGDKGRPFRVQTSDVMIEVLGTRFNVMAFPESEISETALLEGRVRITRENPVSGEKQSVILTPGHKATFFRGEERFIMDRMNAEEAIAWRSGRLAFDNAVFRSVIERMERRYDIDISLRDEAIGDLRISIQIDDESLEEILAIISKTLSVDYTHDEGRVVFFPEGSGSPDQ